MAKNKEQIDEQLFKVFEDKELTSESHIRDIWVKYKDYYPCKEYKQIEKIDEALEKLNENLSKLKDPNSILCNNIKQGIFTKKKKKPKKQYKQ